ncbi:hypothetical protein KA977_07155 [Candidatus Dependentiae bacterium]|nr:hypothetical protein [Candidatus Dependentiae bacterium]
MLKKVFTIIILVALMSYCAIAADEAAAPAAGDANTTQAAAVEMKGTKGFVVSLDENSIVIVDDNNQNVTFKIEKSTKFVDAPNNNAIVTASGIVVDDRVRVDVKEGDSAYQVVKLITELSRKKAADSTETKEAAPAENKEAAPATEQK